jgi:hypothetical protein
VVSRETERAVSLRRWFNRPHGPNPPRADQVDQDERVCARCGTRATKKSKKLFGRYQRFPLDTLAKSFPGVVFEHSTSTFVCCRCVMSLRRQAHVSAPQLDGVEHPHLSQVFDCVCQ